jgi:hypothetical protein
LSYSSNLQFVRVATDGARNAASEPTLAAAGKFSVTLTGTPAASGGPLVVPYDGATTVSFVATDSDNLDSVAAALADALTVAGVTGVALDSDAVAGLIDPTVLYDAGSYTLPTSLTVDGVTFTFNTNTGIESGVTETTQVTIANFEDFLTSGAATANGSVLARYLGQKGNSIGVLIVDAGIDDSDFDNA